MQMFKAKGQFLMLLSTMITIAGFANAAYAQRLELRSISSSGTGCPEGEVVTSISEDGQAFSIFFDNFTIETNGEIRRGTQVARSSCELRLQFQAPAGWQYSLMQMDFRGFGNIPKHGHGYVHTSFKNEKHGWRWLRPMILRGPVADEYFFSRSTPVDTSVWSSCEGAPRTLRLNTTLTLITPNRTSGLITLNSLDGELTQQKFRVEWRRCKS
jgi:hypothetical protein